MYFVGQQVYKCFWSHFGVRELAVREKREKAQLVLVYQYREKKGTETILDISVLKNLYV